MGEWGEREGGKKGGKGRVVSRDRLSRVGPEKLKEESAFGPQPKALSLGKREGYVNSFVSLWSC